MYYPKMIMFDYGDTLVKEPVRDDLRGVEALFRYVKVNKKNVTPHQVCELSKKLRKSGYELYKKNFSAAFIRIS